MSTRKYTNRRYLDALEKKVLVFDGAMGTNLQDLHLGAENFGGEINGCNDYLVDLYPEGVEKIHRSFLEVGVDVIETDSFRANRISMKEYGLQDRVIEINRAAARLARRLADEYSQPKPSDDQRSTLGTTRLRRRFDRPSGKLPSANDPELSNISFDELVDIFREQALGFDPGGRRPALEMVFQHLNINELYRLSWGAKNTHGAEWDNLKAEFDAPPAIT